MKIDYLSDLHANHHVDKLKAGLKWEMATKKWVENMLKDSNGDILVIAGDFGTYTEQNLWVLEEAAKHYEKVVFVTGNHDRYLTNLQQLKNYQTSTNKVTDFLEKASGIAHVTPLERAVIQHKGVTIAGDSLWYKFKAKEDIERYLKETNDANYIIEDVFQHQVPDFLYDRAMGWYGQLRGKDIDLMVSHVSPIYPPISSFEEDARFVCPTDFLVGNHWIAGHTHIRGRFQHESTQFHFHALGYPGEIENTSSRPYKPSQFEILK